MLFLLILRLVCFLCRRVWYLETCRRKRNHLSVFPSELLSTFCASFYMIDYSSKWLNETRMIPCNSEFRAYALVTHCVFHFSHFELYFALHSCVLSTFQQHLLQFPTIIWSIIMLVLFFIMMNFRDLEPLINWTTYLFLQFVISLSTASRNQPACMSFIIAKR